MVALRSRRLEGLFGSRLEELAHSQITSLVGSGVTESFDLDFKSELYGRGDKDKRDLGGDVAAMANTAGGVILLGIVEDAQARAASAPGVALGDIEVGRIRQIVASQVSPLPVFDVLQIEDAAQPGHGFIVIAVPRSPSAPHAVLVNEALRFPKRNGTTTTYLSEPEVAQAYAARLAGIVSRTNELAESQSEFVARLDTAGQTYAVVTLVPDLPGSLEINTKVWHDFQMSIMGTSPLVLPLGVSWQHASVASRRLVADASLDSTRAVGRMACELHESGAGSFAVVIGRTRDDKSTEIEVFDETLVNAVWSGLRFLAVHARDRAAAGGNASVRALIWPAFGSFPVILAHTRQGFSEPLGRQAAVVSPVSTGIFNIDDLAENGAPVLSATFELVTGLVQTFGQPETLQVSREGALRMRYWGHSYRQVLEGWAAAAGVKLSEEIAGQS